jgi:hypothetical protein
LREGIMNLVDQDRPGQNAGMAEVAYAVVLFAFYFVNYLVIVFFNTALVSCAIIRFRGGDPTLGDGLRAAGMRMPQIIGWALLSATVGVILRMIEEKSEWVGQLVAGIIGTVWAVATYLAVPILAVEGVGPVEALKRSAALIRRTWGEGLAGNFGLGLIGFLMHLPGFLLIVLGGFAFSKTVPLGVALVVLGVFAILAASIVLSTLKQIFIAGLYIYATEERVPSGFSADLMRGAFAPKR